MYGYKIKKPKALPQPVWACKTSVDNYEWENRQYPDMLEFGYCKAAERTVCIGDREPIKVFGKSLSCIAGSHTNKSYADDGVNVEILSVAVRLAGLEYTCKEFDDKDVEEKDIILLPCLLTNIPQKEWMEIENLLYRYISEVVKKDTSSELICHSLIFELLAMLDVWVRKSLKGRSREYLNYYILKADSIISNRYSEKLTLRLVSEELGITPNYLSAMYKSCTGVGFSDRLCSVRMSVAAKMVVEKGISLSDIVQAVGFEDEGHLRRRFKQYFGVSIREYRCVNREQTLYHEKPLRKDKE